jgi:hypothetical protein
MNKDYISGLVGFATPMIAVITSFQEQIEFWLRISGLVVGLIVGLISLYHQIKKL